MIILYIIAGIITAFFASKKLHKTHDTFETNLLVSIIGVFWIVVAPVYIFWMILEKLYTKFNKDEN